MSLYPWSLYPLHGLAQVVNDFWSQLKAAEKESEKVQEEQEAVVEKKNEALEALEAARRELDATMAGYRENRKFSLQVRLECCMQA